MRVGVRVCVCVFECVSACVCCVRVCERVSVCRVFICFRVTQLLLFRGFSPFFSSAWSEIKRKPS